MSKLATFLRGKIDRREITQAELVAFLRAVGGDIDHVYRLLLVPEPNTTAEQLGREEAKRYIEQIKARTPQQPEEANERYQRAIEIAQGLLSDPRKLDRLIGYGERLQEE